MLKSIQELMNIVMRIAPELYAGAWGRIPGRMAALACWRSSCSEMAGES